MPALPTGTHPAFTEKYIRLVDADSVSEAIQKYSDSILAFFKNLPEEKLEYRYAEGKWNLKETLQHVIDTERIFAYRALRIARHDKTPLPGFDQTSYAAATHASARKWESLLLELEAVRLSTNLLLESFTEEQLQQSGTTSGEPNTVLAISYTIFGHILHHINLIKERYL